MGLFAAGIIIAALVVPIINTGLFIIGATVFFSSIYGNMINVINAVLTTNFLIEFLVSAILSPVLVYLIKALTYQNDLGFTTDFSTFNKTEEEDNNDNQELCNEQ